MNFAEFREKQITSASGNLNRIFLDYRNDTQAVVRALLTDDMVLEYRQEDPATGNSHFYCELHGVIPGASLKIYTDVEWSPLKAEYRHDVRAPYTRIALQKHVGFDKLVSAMHASGALHEAYNRGVQSGAIIGWMPERPAPGAA